MSSQAVVEKLNPRQQQTVERLLDAGAEELREAGLEAITIRTVAVRAGVSSATAYTYFTSKDHLFAQLFLRHLLTHPTPAGRQADAVERLSNLTRVMAEDLADAPHLAAAATRALLGTDPAVERLRIRIGNEYLARFRQALGQTYDEAVLDTILTTFLGAMLQTGMGLSTYSQMADRLDASIAVILKGH